MFGATMLGPRACSDCTEEVQRVLAIPQPHRPDNIPTQSSIGLCLYLPFPNLPFWACGMYFDCKVKWTWPVNIYIYIEIHTHKHSMDEYG